MLTQFPFHMPEPTLSELSAKIEAGFASVDKQFGQMNKRFDKLERSAAATDAVVTALYAELVGNRPNLRDRLAVLEANVHKLIELTPSASAELQQPVYDA